MFEKIIEKAKKDKKVIAVLLFGSMARGEENRDIDICLVLNKKYSNLELSKKKIEYSSFGFDVSVFQQLPVYIKIRILKEGKILLNRDEPLLYEIAFSTIKEFGFYKKIYDLYLREVK